MSKDEKIQKLEEAKELLNQAVELVAEVFPKDGNVNAYWIDQVSEHIEKCNRYNLDINDLIERVQESEDDEDEPDFDDSELMEEEELEN